MVWLQVQALGKGVRVDAGVHAVVRGGMGASTYVCGHAHLRGCVCVRMCVCLHVQNTCMYCCAQAARTSIRRGAVLGTACSMTPGPVHCLAKMPKTHP